MLFVFLQSLLLSLILFFTAFKIYNGKSKRWGGIIFILTFIGLVLVHQELELTMQLQGLLWGSLAILFFGFWDDWKNLSWQRQLAFQLFLVGILIFFNFQIDNLRGFNEVFFRLDMFFWQGISILSVLFIFFWLTGVINAVNWLDGVDSSLGVVALLGGLSILMVSFFPEVNQPAVATLASIFLGSIVSFLFFNFPPAKIEAGTTGSYFVGFILAGLAIMAGSKIITLMVVLLLPFFDFLWVIVERWFDGQSIFQKDKRHLHYCLRKKGLSDWQIFLIYFIFLGSVLVLYSLLATRTERLILLILEIFFLIITFWFVKK